MLFRKFLKAGGKITPKIPSIEDIEEEIENQRPIMALLTSDFLLSDKARFNFHFNVIDHDEKIEVYTTTPEAIFGATFVALAYNHTFIHKIKKTDEIKNFIDKCGHNSTAEADIEKTRKEAVFTGFLAEHPFDKSIKLPIIITNFVLMDYGTGAIYGCPAHDQRDFELTQVTENLSIKQIAESKNTEIDLTHEAYIYKEDDIIINSSFLTGMTVAEARKSIIDKFEEAGIGTRMINYRLRDWGISRQRYWGCPIPIIYCDKCGTLPVPTTDLPVTLPQDISFEKLGNPLDHHPSWKHIVCHQ